MQKLFKHIYFLLINVIPNKKLRHFLREKYNEFFELHFVPAEAVRKKFAFLKGEYKTVAFGSSHCQTMFNPDCMESSFNFGLNSGDAFMFYETYKNLIKNSKTKNIIILYDVFTRGSDNTKRLGFTFTFLPFKYILGINYPFENKRIENIVKKYEKEFIEQDENYKGFTPLEVPIIKDSGIQSRCRSHLKVWGLGKEYKWIIKLEKECFSDNKNFILVISPASDAYKQYMPDSNTLFKDIIEEVKNVEGFEKQGKIYNFYDSNALQDKSLWIDVDHTNTKGSELFTKLLDEKLRQDNLL